MSDSSSPSGTQGFASAAPLLTKDEVERFSRQIMVEGIGATGMTAIRRGRVCCIGAGGLGSTIALYLAAAGVGTLTLVDFDDVEVSNLHRQVIHSTARVGEKKVHSARDACLALYPSADVRAVAEPFSPQNALRLLKNCDVVVDGTDNVATRYLINDAAMWLGKPLVSGSAMRWEGQLTVYGHAGGPCYRCLFPQAPPPAAVGSCNDSGVMGPVPGMIGCLQALEVLKLLAQAGESLSGRMFVFDGLRMTARVVTLRPRQATCCVLCGDDAQQARQQQPTSEKEKENDAFLSFVHERPEYADGSAGIGAGCGVGGAVHSASVLPAEEARCSAAAFAKAWRAAHPKNDDSSSRPTEEARRERTRGVSLCVDVRVSIQFDMCRLPGSHSLPLPEMQRWQREGTLNNQWSLFLLETLRKDGKLAEAITTASGGDGEGGVLTVYLLCRRGVASVQATDLLLRNLPVCKDSSSSGGTPRHEHTSNLRTVILHDDESKTRLSVALVNVDGGLNAYHRQVDVDFPLY